MLGGAGRRGLLPAFRVRAFAATLFSCFRDVYSSMLHVKKAKAYR